MNVRSRNAFRLFAGAALLASALGAAAEQPAEAPTPRAKSAAFVAYSPRVVGTVRPDLSSYETLLQSPRFAGKQGEELALAIYSYFTSTQDGTYHFWSPNENEGEPRLRGDVYDPVKYLNCYGWMLCGNHATLLYGLYRAAGFQAHQFGLPGHSVCEVYYEGRWHFLDIDMWTWFRTPEGHIAGAYELAKNAKALIVDNKNKSNPCNLPDRDLEGYADMYSRAKTVDAEKRVADIWPPWTTQAHTMDFQLRPGETLMRSQVAQGRFHFPNSWLKSVKNVSKEWKGHPSERYQPYRTYGNGKWTYAPNLSSKYLDFDLAAWERKGLTQDETGVLGQGSATIRIQSPYLFCGIPDLTGPQVKHADGVWLELAGSGPATFEVDDAEGQWHTVFTAPAGEFKQRLDITALLEARYACLLRFTLAENAKLTAFKFDGYLLTAPMSLPRLLEGANQMTVRYLDKHQLCTVPWPQILDFRNKAGFAAQGIALANAVEKTSDSGWKSVEPKDPAQPLKLTFRFDAPNGNKLAWFYALGTVAEGPVEQAPRSALLEWSLDGKAWAPCAGLRISRTSAQWDDSIDAEVLLAPQFASTVWLRLTSDTPVSGFEFHGHLEGGPESDKNVEITHRWSENGQPKVFKAPFGVLNYALLCGPNPTDHTIEMNVPSRKRE